MAAISDLRNRIDNLYVTVTQIYIATCHPAETLHNSIGIPTLPLTSMEDFRLWEDIILDEEKKLTMVRKYFSFSLLCLKNFYYNGCFFILYFLYVTDSTIHRTLHRRFKRLYILHNAQAHDK